MSKQTIGKDENGVFHPGKGKPSGINKEEGLGMQATAPEKMDEYLDITEKYTDGEEHLDQAAHLRHPNRNTSKGEDTYKAKENKPASDKTAALQTEGNLDAAVAEELPTTVTREQFSALATFTSEHCVTMYIDSHRSGVEVNEGYDLVNFKNQLQSIQQQLAARGFNEADVKTIVEPANELMKDAAFWKTLSAGLGLFIAPGFFKYIRLSVPPGENLVSIGSHFNLTPLISVMSCKGYFYLLVISKKTATLFKADACGIQKMDVELPQGIDQVKRLSDLDATTFRSGGTGARAPRQSQEGSYHGVGGGNPDEKDNLLVYFEAVDDALWDQVLNKENAPLLLAAVDYEIPIYRKACDYHNVWPEALTGSREHQDAGTLYRDAKQVMQPYFDEKMNKAINRYLNNSANEKTTSIVDEVIPAAYYAQVAQLFVCKGTHIWGNFNEANNTLVLHDEPATGDDDMINAAVTKTLANGGEVFLLEQTAMPAPSPLAAILRF